MSASLLNQLPFDDDAGLITDHRQEQHDPAAAAHAAVKNTVQPSQRAFLDRHCVATFELVAQMDEAVCAHARADKLYNVVLDLGGDATEADDATNAPRVIDL